MTVIRRTLFYIAAAAMLIFLDTANGFSQTDSASIIQSDKAAYHKAAADTYLKQGRTSMAIVEYQKAVSIDPEWTAAYFNLAIAYYSERNLEGAIWALEKLITLDPEDTEARYNLACLYLYTGDSVSSRLQFEKAGTCCYRDVRFSSFIQQGLEFLDQLDALQELNPSTQDLISFLFRKGLPSLSL